MKHSDQLLASIKIHYDQQHLPETERKNHNN